MTTTSIQEGVDMYLPTLVPSFHREMESSGKTARELLADVDYGGDGCFSVPAFIFRGMKTGFWWPVIMVIAGLAAVVTKSFSLAGVVPLLVALSVVVVLMLLAKAIAYHKLRQQLIQRKATYLEFGERCDVLEDHIGRIRVTFALGERNLDDFTTVFGEYCRNLSGQSGEWRRLKVFDPKPGLKITTPYGLRLLVEDFTTAEDKTSIRVKIVGLRRWRLLLGM